MGELTEWAEEEIQEHLSSQPDRLAHSLSAGRQAESVARLLEPEERPILVTAALLHDIGYSPRLQDTGFHPLDGANYLDRARRSRLAGLVANHSGARIEADLRGLSKEMERYPAEESKLADALTYSDLTTGPIRLFDAGGADKGERVSLDDRLKEVRRNHGEYDSVRRSLDICESRFRDLVVRIENRLAMTLNAHEPA